MTNLIYEAYGPGLAVFFAATLYLAIGTFAVTCIYFRKEISHWALMKLESWAIRMQPFFYDHEDECPEWADPNLWKASLH